MFSTYDSTYEMGTSRKNVKNVRFAVEPIVGQVPIRPVSMSELGRPKENTIIRKKPTGSSVIDLTATSSPKLLVTSDKEKTTDDNEKPTLEMRLGQYYDDLFDPSIEMDLIHFMRISDNDQMPSPTPIPDTRKRNLTGPTTIPQTQPQIIKRSKTIGDPVKCQYCFDSFQRITGFKADPVKNGPWNWHEMVDPQGQIRCPRFWYSELERVNELNKSAQSGTQQ